MINGRASSFSSGALGTVLDYSLPSTPAMTVAKKVKADCFILGIIHLAL